MKTEALSFWLFERREPDNPATTMQIKKILATLAALTMIGTISLIPASADDTTVIKNVVPPTETTTDAPGDDDMPESGNTDTNGNNNDDTGGSSETGGSNTEGNENEGGSNDGPGNDDQPEATGGSSGTEGTDEPGGTDNTGGSTENPDGGTSEGSDNEPDKEQGGSDGSSSDGESDKGGSESEDNKGSEEAPDAETKDNGNYQESDDDTLPTPIKDDQPIILIPSETENNDQGLGGKITPTGNTDKSSNIGSSTTGNNASANRKFRDDSGKSSTDENSSPKTGAAEGVSLVSLVGAAIVALNKKR